MQLTCDIDKIIFTNDTGQDCFYFPCFKYSVAGGNVTLKDCRGEKLNINPDNYPDFADADAVVDFIEAANVAFDCGKKDVEEEEVIKPMLDPYYVKIEDDSKYTFTPPSAVDKIQVGMSDPSMCEYVRVTLICPDGVLGCTLLSPSQPQKNISLKDYLEVTDICVEVVSPQSGVPVKSWATSVPGTPIEINMDGLNS